MCTCACVSAILSFKADVQFSHFLLWMLTLEQLEKNLVKTREKKILSNTDEKLEKIVKNLRTTQDKLKKKNKKKTQEQIWEHVEKT